MMEKLGAIENKEVQKYTCLFSDSHHKHTPVTKQTQITSAPHLMATPQLYFHSLCINSLSENDTHALLQLQVDSGQVTALLWKIDTGAKGNVIPVDT